MRFSIITVGKLRNGGIRDAVEDYLQRMRRHGQCDWVEVRKESKGDPLRVKEAEAERLLAAAKGQIVALDEHGKQVTSVKLAEKLQVWADQGHREASFVIGGAFGLGDSVLTRAHWKWSLSNLTLNHEHVPLILAEQLYRAGTIQRGEPYHNP